MKIDFSKPSGDLAKESTELREADADRRRMQRQVSVALTKGTPRLRCVLCGNPLSAAEVFLHREIEYSSCLTCGHIQSRMEPPPGYPHSHGGPGFPDVYPSLEPGEYASRRDRIYRPKLEWILGCHAEVGLTQGQMIEKRWIELGCGAGYFLSALQEAGVKRFLGIDSDPKLVESARSAVGGDRVRHYEGALSEALAGTDVDIIAAFFVLEHLADARAFFENLRAHKRGTVFAFSVPAFGLAAMLESAFDVHSARTLDGILHTQIYTDRSIRHGLDLAGYEMAGQWVFGQDAIDFQRLLVVSLERRYGPRMMGFVSETLGRIVDPFQSVLDRGGLADARHVVAVRR